MSSPTSDSDESDDAASDSPESPQRLNSAGTVDCWLRKEKEGKEDGAERDSKDGKSLVGEGDEKTLFSSLPVSFRIMQIVCSKMVFLSNLPASGRSVRSSSK